jgi:hypothetical protein
MRIHQVEMLSQEQARMAQGLPRHIPDPVRITEICEWCKEPVRMMCHKGTGVCSQNCARMASHILYDDPEKAKKFGGGYSGETNVTS